MIERQLAVISYKNHLLSAVFQGNELYDIIVEPAVAEQTIATGDIYLAKVKNVVPNIQAAFLEVTKNNMCYLPLKKEEFSEVMQGMEFPVQIIKPAVKSKQPVCSRKLELAGMYAVITTDITTKNISKKNNRFFAAGEDGTYSFAVCRRRIWNDPADDVSKCKR